MARTRIDWTPNALADLVRLRAFLRPKNPRAAEAAIDTIHLAIDALRDFPQSGRLLDPEQDDMEYREVPVPFSNSGYVVLYFVGTGVIEIQAIKHMREADYLAPPSA